MYPSEKTKSISKMVIQKSKRNQVFFSSSFSTVSETCKLLEIVICTRKISFSLFPGWGPWRRQAAGFLSRHLLRFCRGTSRITRDQSCGTLSARVRLGGLLSARVRFCFHSSSAFTRGGRGLVSALAHVTLRDTECSLSGCGASGGTRRSLSRCPCSSQTEMGSRFRSVHPQLCCCLVLLDTTK